MWIDKDSKIIIETENTIIQESLKYADENQFVVIMNHCYSKITSDWMWWHERSYLVNKNVICGDN